MNSRNLVRLFFSTLLIGGLTAGVVGFIAPMGESEQVALSVSGILSSFFWYFGVGLIFSVISQMGFFAYLTVHRFGLGIFKSVKLWNSVQVVLIAFVLFDLVYFRFVSFGEGESIVSYVLVALLLLFVGLIVAYLKMKQTNHHAFIPALFFMTVVTIVEWVPVLRVNDKSWMYFMLIPLLLCNAYQLLILSKLNEKSAQELAMKKQQK
ncbi:KinB-signaling pathway activation protein [Peribacillus tepidiphilus]|uniref:KinB-signaling pathway activation protein n=1 Tax=Peribacillus tepidiphilus TaxID=2652445 RepID=UPI0035B56699